MAKHTRASGATTSEAKVTASSGSAKIAWIVIGLAVLIGMILGFFVYYRAKDGAYEIGQQLIEAREKGATLTGEACITYSLDWYEGQCPAPGRMCIEAVPRLVAECLAAKDRSDLCVEIGNDEKPSQWAYNRCKARGVERASDKGVKESCTQAWRALDTYCKTGQKGVAL